MKLSEKQIIKILVKAMEENDPSLVLEYLNVEDYNMEYTNDEKIDIYSTLIDENGEKSNSGYQNPKNDYRRVSFSKNDIEKKENSTTIHSISMKEDAKNNLGYTLTLSNFKGGSIMYSVKEGGTHIEKTTHTKNTRKPSVKIPLDRPLYSEKNKEMRNVTKEDSVEEEINNKNNLILSEKITKKEIIFLKTKVLGYGIRPSSTKRDGEWTTKNFTEFLSNGAGNSRDLGTVKRLLDKERERGTDLKQIYAAYGSKEVAREAGYDMLDKVISSVENNIAGYFGYNMEELSYETKIKQERLLEDVLLWKFSNSDLNDYQFSNYQDLDLEFNDDRITLRKEPDKYVQVFLPRLNNRTFLDDLQDKFEHLDNIENERDRSNSKQKELKIINNTKNGEVKLEDREKKLEK